MGERYDTVVIGSGIGGLAAAACLARVAGQRVLVLERHFVAGGFTHTFRRQGFSWDVGVHYVGGLDAFEDARKMMDFITGGEVRWNRLPPRFERFSYPGLEFEMSEDVATYRADLLRTFPDEAQNLEAYVRDLRRVESWLDRYVMARTMPTWLGGPVTWAGRSFALQTTGAYLHRRFRDPRLRALLTSQWGDILLPPGESALAAHALIARHYHRGAWYPEGGAGRIAAGAKRVIEAAGGRVLVQHEVTEILRSGGVACGVRGTAGPSRSARPFVFEASTVISDAGVERTFGHLLPPSGLPEQAARPPSGGRSMVIAFLGLSASPEALGMDAANHWFFGDDDHDAAVGETAAVLEGRPPMVYLSPQSTRDPSARRHAVQILTSVDTAAFSAWEQSTWRARPEAYTAAKARILDGLVSVVERRYPGFAATIVHRELATPLTISHFTGHPRGQVYGVPLTPARFRDSRHRVLTSVPRLFLAGADALSVGVVGAMMGGAMAAGSSLGKIGFIDMIRAARAAAAAMPATARLSG